MSKPFATPDGVDDSHQGSCYVYHQRKPNRFQSTSDILLRGSSEKVAAADVVLSVRKVEENYEIEQSKARLSEAIPKFQVSICGINKDPVVIKYLGESTQIRNRVRFEQTKDMIFDLLNSRKDWVARGDMVKAGEALGLSNKLLDESLKPLVTDGIIERKDVSSTGKGGKHAEYRLKPSEPDDQRDTEEEPA